MSAFYNEIDPYAAQWLRNLITAGHIAPGVVDERSIQDICPDELKQYTQCHFFAGIGAWSLALRRAGWPDERPVWTGSCPCQPFSAAGAGAGFDDERHLWPDWFHLIDQCRPDTIFGEQVEAAIKHAWLDLVQTDLEAIGYACGAIGFPAASVGAPHIRQRLYWMGRATDTNSAGLSRVHGDGESRKTETASSWGEFSRIHAASSWQSWLSKSGAGVLINGAANRVGRLRAYGNAIVPQQAEAFVRAYLLTNP